MNTLILKGIVFMKKAKLMWLFGALAIFLVLAIIYTVICTDRQTEDDKLEFMLEYLYEVSQPNHIVMIAVWDEASHGFSDSIAEAFVLLGLSYNLQNKFRYAYVAIIDGGEVVYERLGDTNTDIVSVSTSIRDVLIEITSVGQEATLRGDLTRTSIRVDDWEYALVNRGINIVVYDKQLEMVVDSVSFDTFADLSFSRMHHVDLTPYRRRWWYTYGDNYIVEQDREWLQDVRLVAHAMGGLDKEEGRMYYTNSLEAFKQNYEVGHRFFEVDFTLSADGILFTRHVGRGPFETFEKEQALVPYTLLTIHDVAELMLEYIDIYIITDTKEAVDFEVIRKQFDIISHTLEEVEPLLKQRFIIQFYNQAMYYFLRLYYDFPLLIYTLYMSPDSNESVVEFVRVHRIPAVIMFDRRANHDFVRNLSEVDAAVFAHFPSTEVDIDNISNLFANGVHGIWTFSLSPDDLIQFELEPMMQIND